MVHVRSRLLDHLDHTGFDRILVFDALEAGLANFTSFGLLLLVTAGLRGGALQHSLLRGVHGEGS